MGFGDRLARKSYRLRSGRGALSSKPHRASSRIGGRSGGAGIGTDAIAAHQIRRRSSNPSDPSTRARTLAMQLGSISGTLEMNDRAPIPSA